MIEPRPKLPTFACCCTPINRTTGIRAYFGEAPATKNAGVDPGAFYRPWTGS